MSNVVRFAIRGVADRGAVEADIALAIFAAECVFGRPRVRMETSYLVGSDGKTCVIDVDGESGEAAARVFSGLTAARVGEQAFCVERV